MELEAVGIFQRDKFEHGQKHLKFYFCCHSIIGTNIFLKIVVSAFKVMYAPN